MAIDYLVIGGGTAGSVLASRLSEDKLNSVVLLEAGSDVSPNSTPWDIADIFPQSSLNPDYFCPGLIASTVAGGPKRPYSQAKVMGGGSSIRGMLSLRGVPSDYERWVRDGASRLDWRTAQELYQVIEKNVDAPSFPGNSAQYSIRLSRPSEDWPDLVYQVKQTTSRLGIPNVDDINAGHGQGFFSMPVARDEQFRSTSSGCYLDGSVRSRSNLQIMAKVRVERLVFSGARAVGAEVAIDRPQTAVFAHNVVICAGAIHAPALLQRSGIGDGNHLAQLGIGIVAPRCRRGEEPSKPRLPVVNGRQASPLHGARGWPLSTAMAARSAARSALGVALWR